MRWSWARRLTALAWGAAVVVPVLVLGVLVVWPVGAMIGRGLVVDGQVDIAGVGEILTRSRTWRVFGQTILQATMATLVSVVLGVPGAHALYGAGPFRGRGVLRTVVTVPFVLPTVVVGVAFRSLLQETGPMGFLGLDHSLTAVVMALVFFNYSVVVRTVGGMWERLDPRTVQAAQALGASPVRVFFTVTLPRLAPAIASGAAVVFLFSATAFGTVLVLGGTRFATIETEIWIQTTQYLDLRAAAVLSVAQLMVVLVALGAAGRARVARERAVQMVDTAAVRRGGRGTLVVTGVVVVGLAAPVVALAIRSVQVGSGWGLDHYRALGMPVPGLGVSALQAAVTSMRIAVDATVFALIVGGFLALVLSRRPTRRWAQRFIAGLDAVAMLPLGVSAVTVGFGLLLVLHQPWGLNVDFRTSPFLVPAAQAVVAVPLVVRTVLPVLRAIDPRQHQVAAALGASPWRVLATIDVPVAVRAWGLAAGFAFAVSLGEFGATSFLYRPDRPTLPVVVFRLIGRPDQASSGQAFAAAMLLAILAGGAVAIVERWRTRAVGTEW